MRLASTARVLSNGVLWRLGIVAAGRGLIQALGSSDEDLRTLAGMFLVRAGQRSEPLLREALQRRQNLPIVLTILGDIGQRNLEPEIRGLTRDSDPDIARAAREALRVLEAR